MLSLEDLSTAADCLKTIAHPHRLRMIQMMLHGRYTVGDETFEPVQVVNPVYQAGIVAHATFGHVFVRVAPTYRLSLPSAKNRAVDQSPPDGTVHVDLAAGWAF